MSRRAITLLTFICINLALTEQSDCYPIADRRGAKAIFENVGDAKTKLADLDRLAMYRREIAGPDPPTGPSVACLCLLSSAADLCQAGKCNRTRFEVGGAVLKPGD